MRQFEIRQLVLLDSLQQQRRSIGNRARPVAATPAALRSFGRQDWCARCLRDRVGPGERAPQPPVL